MLVALVVGAIAPAAAPPRPATAWVSGATAAYRPAGPARLADTRTGGGFDRIDAHTIRVAVAGRGGGSG